ncbi:hypothetical protein QTN47_18390 [Danxiaibacter flavus]|uniref:DUF4136 domain-containing protein n=1 Tax=Danxiaibacter flavus TaxID=3049108 RepID=A0ABV3ZI22_9BACT|nr:hypothetical protein QNM32_18400 [Chitinophagaceae bacterium DXS]
MKNFCFILMSLVVGICLTQCSKQTLKITGSWVKKDSLPKQANESVFIAALTQNTETRTILESDLADGARANGIKAVKSLDVFGPVTANTDTAVIASLIRKVKESGCSSILTVSLLDEKNKTTYTKSSEYTYQPYPYGGYYGNFASYYSFVAGSTFQPGYYSTDKTYYIETNLYDVNSLGILFSIQTKAMNPPAINKASQQFTETLLNELKSNGLLKKKA